MTQEVQAAALDIVGALRSSSPSLDEIVTSRIYREPSETATDPEMTDLLRASVEGNTVLLRHMLMNDLESSTFQLSAASTEYAHRLARRGVGANTLLAAYQIGHIAADEALHGELQQRNYSDALARAVSEFLSRKTLTCVNWITSAAMEAYEAERVRLARTGSSEIAAAVRAVLAGSGPSSQEFARRTGHTLDGRHLGLQVWTTDAEPAGTIVADVAHAVLRNHPHLASLTVSVDTVTAHLWLLVSDSEPNAASLEAAARSTPNDVRIAVGSVLTGRDGFIRTIEQAQAAAHVAACRSHPPTVQFWSEPGVPLASILLKDFEASRAWVRETLGPLAQATKEAQILRETLAVFLNSHLSWTLSAERLHLHRNSVRYRVERAVALLGLATHTDLPPDVSTALQAAELLGDPILVTPSKTVETNEGARHA